MSNEFRECHGDDAAVTEAVGKASEALEYVERARGHLYSLHQLIGRADLLFEEPYHGFVTEVVRDLEREFHDGERHVYEAQMKEQRRTTGEPGHEHRPAA